MTDRSRGDDPRPLELGGAGTDLRRSLVEAVLRGRKTATASLRIEYEPHTAEALPRAGERFTMLDVDDEPIGLVETISINVVSACDVDLAFALDEGEGFVTVAEWRAAHEQFWIDTGIIEELTDEALVVCERFRLVERAEEE